MRKKKIWLILSSVILIIAIGCGIYINDYYHADKMAIESIEKPTASIDVIEKENERIVFRPEHPRAGLIFYPGGKVEYKAYAPLMEACAEKGILCVLLHMPGNLAVLDMNAAEGIREEFPEIEKWYIGGHSLGGSMAASYLGKHAEEFEGLLLLASYSTEDLSAYDLKILSIYGTEDRVLNAEKYKSNKENLPEDFREVVIEGGCHAYFGNYGEQKGDGTPAISNQEQIDITADAVIEFIQSQKEEDAL